MGAASRDVVDDAHTEALTAGGRDQGAAGERMPGLYGAYLRDFDGAKFCIFRMG